MSKLFFYDLETTGVKYWKNGIHQISGAIVIDGEIAERFDFKVRPFDTCTIEDSALDVAGVTREQVLSYESMISVYTKLLRMLSKYVVKFNKKDKFHLVGYNNAAFDNHFFRAFFVQNNDQYFGSWFWSDSIDVMVLASHKFKDKRSTLSDFKQATVAAACGINVDPDKLHDAIYDIDLCIGIYNYLEAQK